MRHIRSMVTLLRRVDLHVTALLPSVFLSLVATFFSLKFYSVIIELSRILVEGSVAENGTRFLQLLGICYAVATLKSVANYLGTMSTKALALKAADRTREILIQRMMSFGKQFFDQTSTGYLQHLIQKSADNVSEQLGNFHLTLSGTFLFLAYVGMMLWISTPLTLLVFVLLASVALVSKKLLHTIRESSEKAVTLQSSLSHHISEIIAGMTIIKALSMAKSEQKTFSDISRKETASTLSRVKMLELAKPIQDLAQVTILVLVSVAIYGLAETSAAFPMSNVFVFIYLVMASINTFNSNLQSLATLTNATAGIESLNVFFDDAGKVFIREGNREFPGLRGTIEFRNLHFSYSPGIPILKGVSFMVQRGQVAALVGPTGGGKTSLVNLLMRFYDCPPGSLLIDGVDIREYSLESLLSRIAYVPQDIFLFNQSFRHNLLYGIDRNITEAELAAVVETCCLGELVRSLPSGLNALIGPRGVTLSGGEKQRIAIARAFLMRREILILDEATSAMDVATEKKIYEAIAQISGQKTILLLSHRLSTLIHADKIIVIQDGVAAEEGNYRGLVAKKGHFHHLWQSSTNI